MKRFLILAAFAAVLGLAGCSQEEKVETKEKVVTPGGTTTHTVTDKVDKTGDHKVGSKHTADCTCVKDADGGCDCTKAGTACKCAVEHSKP